MLQECQGLKFRDLLNYLNVNSFQMVTLFILFYTTLVKIWLCAVWFQFVFVKLKKHLVLTKEPLLYFIFLYLFWIYDHVLICNLMIFMLNILIYDHQNLKSTTSLDTVGFKESKRSPDTKCQDCAIGELAIKLGISSFL